MLCYVLRQLEICGYKPHFKINYFTFIPEFPFYGLNLTESVRLHFLNIEYFQYILSSKHIRYNQNQFLIISFKFVPLAGIQTVSHGPQNYQIFRTEHIFLKKLQKFCEQILFEISDGKVLSSKKVEDTLSSVDKIQAVFRCQIWSFAVGQNHSFIKMSSFD